MKVPKSIAETVAAIHALPLPSREFENVEEFDKLHAEHDKLGSKLETWMCRHLRARLGHEYRVDKCGFKGYSVDWYGGGRHRVPVKPYAHVRVFLPHGPVKKPPTNSTPSKFGACRYMVELSYFPHSGDDLGEWLERWATWLKGAPKS